MPGEVLSPVFDMEMELEETMESFDKEAFIQHLVDSIPGATRDHIQITILPGSIKIIAKIIMPNEHTAE